MEKDREQELIREAIEGDEQAFAELVYATQDLVYTCCLRVLRNPQRAEEAANEAYLRAWRGLAGFRFQARFSSWMFRIAHNAAVRMATKRRLDTVSTDDERHIGLSAVASVDPTIERKLEAEDELALIRELMNELPENQRKALELAYLEGIEYRDAATVLGCPVATLKTWVHRGRKRLRELYIERMGESY